MNASGTVAQSSLVNHTCSGSGHTLALPRRAYDIPIPLHPLLAQLTVAQRQHLAANPLNRTADQLTESIVGLDVVDVDNSIAVAREAAHARTTLRVAELNAERGRWWCELAVQIKSTPELASVDFWLLNEFDLGMARSEQLHTARLLAYALGFNYAWAVEFVELTNGNRAEQLRTRGATNEYGLHGNAMLSRWPLRDAAVVRMQGMAALYSGKGRDTANGYEKRLGGRMTLFATAKLRGWGAAGGEDVVLGATHAQTSWRGDVHHTCASAADMRMHIAQAAQVLIGGDTWASTCHWIGLTPLVATRSGYNAVVRGRVAIKGHVMDDYICARGFSREGSVRRFPCAGKPVGGGAQFVLSDHVHVVVNVRAVSHELVSAGGRQADYRYHPPAAAATATHSCSNGSTPSSPQQRSTGSAAAPHGASGQRAAQSKQPAATGPMVVPWSTHGRTPTQPSAAIDGITGEPSALTCDAVYRWRSPAVEESEAKRIGNVQRYRDNGELRFSMRSFAQVAGMRIFHIVARGKPPAWLNASHPRIAWWDETTLLEELRRERNISAPLNVSNSEPSKLAIARIPTLAERFVLIDDDFYLMPPATGSMRGLTPLFFDRSGLSMQPKHITWSHRPIPFLRDAYLKSARGESTSVIEKILTSGLKRDALGKGFADRKKKRDGIFSVDRLQIWCDDMYRRGTTRRLYSRESQADNAVFGGGKSHNGVRFIAFARSAERDRKPFMNINDDWPHDWAEYLLAIAPVHAFLQRTFPQRQPWEQDEFWGPLSAS